MQKTNPSINRIYDNTEYGDYHWLCEFLGISLHTARRWVSEHRIPFLKLASGSLIRFRKSDISAWLESSRIEAAK